jgi:hypothetical protein
MEPTNLVVFFLKTVFVVVKDACLAVGIYANVLKFNLVPPIYHTPQNYRNVFLFLDIQLCVGVYTSCRIKTKQNYQKYCCNTIFITSM